MSPAARAKRRRSLNGTLRPPRSKGYAYAAGRSTWFLGLIGDGPGPLWRWRRRDYEEALDTFTRMGDVEQAGAMHNLLAALHDYLGDAGSAWQHRLIAFESLSASRSPRFKSRCWLRPCPSIRLESPETALSVQDAALAVAREWRPRSRDRRSSGAARVDCSRA